MSSETKIHDLTLLFLQNSVNLRDLDSPQEYVLKYLAVREQIESAFKDNDFIPAMPPGIQSIKMKK